MADNILPTVSMQNFERYERTCPVCGYITQTHSIDGGLTSLYYSECGHKWKLEPGRKEVLN